MKKTMLFFFIYKHVYIFINGEAYSNVITGIEIWEKIKNSQSKLYYNRNISESERKILEQFLNIRIKFV